MDFKNEKIFAIKQDLMDGFLKSFSRNQDDPSLSLSPPTEVLEKFISSLAPFINYAQTYDELVAGASSEDEIAKQLARDKDGLFVFDSLQQFRCETWSESLRLFLSIVEPSQDHPFIQSVAKAKSLAEMVACFKPELANIVEPTLASLSSLFKLHLTELQLSDSFTLFKSAVACKLANLPDQADLFIEFAIQKIILHQSSEASKLREMIVKEIGALQSRTKAGREGGKKRHSKTELVKKFVIQQYANANFPNVHSASHALADRAKAYAQSFGYDFSNDIQRPRTIGKWLSDYEKSKSN
ncbi:hypothetical protein ACE02B_06240 [Shewanella mangrovisoli]|uniref:hypothetical protein n=1 Tax=Shewanella mangrovisoli TaxID=2864211 RepID=UPI0035B7E224